MAGSTNPPCVLFILEDDGILPAEPEIRGAAGGRCPEGRARVWERAKARAITQDRDAHLPRAVLLDAVMLERAF